HIHIAHHIVLMGQCDLYLVVQIERTKDGDPCSQTGLRLYSTTVHRMIDTHHGTIAKGGNIDFDRELFIHTIFHHSGHSLWRRAIEASHCPIPCGLESIITAHDTIG